MTYTFQPIPFQEPSYFIFWLLIVFFSFVALMINSYYDDFCGYSSYSPSGRPYLYFFVIFAVVLLNYVYHVCETPRAQPKNIQVIAKLVSTSGETVVNNSGKSGYSYSPQLLVQYEVPEGVVTLKGSYGVIYPKEAILYAN